MNKKRYLIIIGILLISILITGCSKIGKTSAFSESKNNTKVYDDSKLTAIPFNDKGGLILLPSNYKMYGYYNIGDSIGDIPYYSDYEELLTVKEIAKDMKKNKGYLAEVTVTNNNDIFAVSVSTKASMDFDNYYNDDSSVKYTNSNGSKSLLRIKGIDPDMVDSPSTYDAAVYYEVDDENAIMIDYMGDMIKSKTISADDFLKQIVDTVIY